MSKSLQISWLTLFANTATVTEAHVSCCCCSAAAHGECYSEVTNQPRLQLQQQPAGLGLPVQPLPSRDFASVLHAHPVVSSFMTCVAERRRWNSRNDNARCAKSWSFGDWRSIVINWKVAGLYTIYHNFPSRPINFFFSFAHCSTLSDRRLFPHSRRTSRCRNHYKSADWRYLRIPRQWLRLTY